VGATGGIGKLNEAEAGQWYFQRYIQHPPTAGEIVFFDRSWYNRGVVEKVDFARMCSADKWFEQVKPVRNRCWSTKAS
jgi:polyphosphate kinase 2 (PPK2 family)